MSSHQDKVTAALKRRQADLPDPEQVKTQFHKPGSRNRKKGFSVERSRRR